MHLRQGLLALAHGQPVYAALTRNMLRRAGLTRADGVAAEKGRREAAAVQRDEARWQALRMTTHLSATAPRDGGLTRIEEVPTPDRLTALDAQSWIGRAV